MSLKRLKNNQLKIILKYTFIAFLKVCKYNLQDDYMYKLKTLVKFLVKILRKMSLYVLKDFQFFCLD